MSLKKEFLKKANGILLSKQIMILAIVCIIGSFVGCILMLLPGFQANLIAFGENLIVHRQLNHKIWYIRFFKTSFLFISICGICTAYCNSVNFAALKIFSKLQILFNCLLILAVLLFIAAINYKFAFNWISSDSSAELLGGKILSEESSIFSVKWYYCTEFWFVYRQIMSIPLFKIFSDWHIVRALNVLFQELFLILAYIFMMKQLKISVKWILFSCMYLLVPISYDYWHDVLFEVYYNLFFAKIFLSMGIFIYLINSSKKPRGIILCLFAFLSLLMGIDGVRTLLDFHFPLFITVLSYCYIFEKEKKGDKKSQYVFISLFSLLFSVAGYLINSKVLHRFFAFAYFNPGFDTWSGGTFFSKLSGILTIILYFFGYSNAPILSTGGILSAFGLIIPGLLFVLCFTNLSKKQNNNIMVKYAKSNIYGPRFFMILYFSINILFHIAVYQFLVIGHASRYFISVLLFSIPVCVFCLINCKRNLKPAVFSVLIIVLSVFLFANGYKYFKEDLDLNINAPREAYVNYLLENDLNFGFATYWSANVTTELSNGKIEVAGLLPTDYTSDNILYRYKWNSPAKFDDPYYYNGKVFLLLSQQEYREQKDKGRLNDTIPSFSDEWYVVLIYPSAVTIHRDIMREQITIKH
jgi:hypothetical protein